MKNIALLIVGILISIEVAANPTVGQGAMHERAGPAGAFESLSGFVDISQNMIQVVSEGAFSRLFIYNVIMNDSECDNKNIPIIFFSDNVLAKEMYSMILTAKATGAQIQLFSSACVNYGGVTYTSVNSIYIR